MVTTAETSTTEVCEDGYELLETATGTSIVALSQRTRTLNLNGEVGLYAHFATSTDAIAFSKRYGLLSHDLDNPEHMHVVRNDRGGHVVSSYPLEAWKTHQKRVRFAMDLLRIVKQNDWRAAAEMMHRMEVKRQLDGTTEFEVQLYGVGIAQGSGGFGQSTAILANDQRLNWAEDNDNQVALCAFALQNLVNTECKDRVGVAMVVRVHPDIDTIRGETVRVARGLLGAIWLEVIHQFEAGNGPSVCEVCSRLFQAERPSRAKYCSSACSQKAYRERTRA